MIQIKNRVSGILKDTEKKKQEKVGKQRDNNKRWKNQTGKNYKSKISGVYVIEDARGLCRLLAMLAHPNVVIIFIPPG